MGSISGRFRRKSTAIRAIEYTGWNSTEVAQWLVVNNYPGQITIEPPKSNTYEREVVIRHASHAKTLTPNLVIVSYSDGSFGYFDRAEFNEAYEEEPDF